MKVREAAAGVRWSERRPEPGSLWIRYWPRRWPGPAGDWLHLATGELGQRGGPADDVRSRSGSRQTGSRQTGSYEIGLSRRAAADDVVYLPPVDAARRPWRDALARQASGGGIPPLAQLLPGEEPPDPVAMPIYDLLTSLLATRLDDLETLPPGSTAVWPLLPGLTDDPARWQPALERMAAAGVACVPPLPVSLSPVDRRRLSERFASPAVAGSERIFDRLFHGGPVPVRELCRHVARRGMSPFFDRPQVAQPGRRARNLELAAMLATVGELWQRLGRPPSSGQGFFRAARWIEGADLDMAALAEEGNLGVLDWLEPASRALVEAWAGGDGCPLLDELRHAYLETDEGPE